MERKINGTLVYWIVAVLLLLTLQNYWQAARTVEPVPCSEFERRWPRGASPKCWCRTERSPGA